MGDRCSLNIEVRNKDLPQVFKITNYEADYWDLIDKGVTTELYLEEANYALTTELAEVAKTGIDFIGEHGAGSCYGAELFVTFYNEVLYVDQGESGDPVMPVRLSLDLEPCLEFMYPTHAEEVRKFLMQRKIVQSIFDAENTKYKKGKT
jgi:hypothetical protein